MQSSDKHTLKNSYTMRTCKGLASCRGGGLLNFGSSREGGGCSLVTGYFICTGYSFHLFACLFVGRLIALSGIFELPKINYYLLTELSTLGTKVY